MDVTIVSPIKAYVNCTEDELYSLKKELTYTNTSIQHLIKRHNDNWRWKNQNFESWEVHLEGLKKDLKKCLVFEDENGYYIRPGSIPYLSDFNLQIENRVEYKKFTKLPWKHPFKFELHPYQIDSIRNLIAEPHSNVSITTGGGKSAIILSLCKEIGLRTCIVVPGKGIFHESIENFEYHLGSKNVGYLGDGKKKYDKRFTIVIGDSVANIKEGTPEYEFFSNLDVLIVDESHTFGADSLESICHGVLGNISRRIFLSATQFRNDGSLPLLRSIIGKTVYELTTQEGVEKSFICPHEFRIVSVESSNPSFNANDGLAQKRVHFLNNKNIASFTAKLANATAISQGKQTLVLCEELSQIAMLIPLLEVPYAIAHSEKNAARLLELGLEKVKVSESIEKFNKNEAKVLIGTSCLHVGVNLYPTHSVVNWFGGSSDIKVKQAAVGRSVRFGKSNPWASKCVPKDKAIIYDFQVLNNRTMERHLQSRIECYEDSGPDLIKYLKLKG